LNKKLKELSLSTSDARSILKNKLKLIFPKNLLKEIIQS